MIPDLDAVRAMMEGVTRFKPWRAGRGGTGMVETVDGPWIAATDYEALAADLAATRAALAEAQGVLREHHNWHLSQDRDANAWGIDPVDAYSGSGLCERTVAALSGGTHDAR